MGKFRGFLESDRKMPSRRPVEERLNDYREIYQGQTEAEIREQAGRCMDCGVPFCQQGCPLGNIIPDWNDLVTKGNWRLAWNRLSATNNFPEFTGRLCPAPCEAACTLAINIDAVTIEQVEKQIVERAYAEGWAAPRPRRPSTGNTVAVVGSGPAGLAAAEQLALAGHAVTVFEKADRVGGLLRYGIPDFKMEKWVIDRRVALMEAEGVSFRVGVDVGTDVTWTELKESFDAIVLAIGAMRARDLDVPGRQELSGVYMAMDYLTQQNKLVAGDRLVDEARISAEGKHVVILGGGDTGSDCLGTALRQGAASVRQIEIMKRPDDVRTEGNPWPQWPFIFRTSSSHEEGGDRDFAFMTTHLSGEGDRVQKLHVVEVQPSATGGFEQVEGTEQVFDCDMLILAMGFTGVVAESLNEQLDVKIGPRGAIAGDDKFRTNVPGIWVAGDAYRGASLIVWAIADGREAARAIDAELRGGESQLPTKGIHQSFGGR